MKKKILNTKGAAAYLGCSENWIHRLVYDGKLKAHVYDEAGVLVERPVGAKRQGASLFFFEQDLDKYKHPRAPQTRPAKGRQYEQAQKEEALRLVAQGMSNREAAKKIGVSYQTINNWTKEERQVSNSR